MKLTSETLQILKNYSTINQNIVFTEGKSINTISEARNILSTVNVEEEFPRNVGIYDLNEFLGVIGLVEDPEIRFEDKYVQVSDQSGRSNIKYYYTDIDMLTMPSDVMIDKAKAMNDFEVEFTIDETTLNRIRRAASTLGHKSVSIKADNGLISLSVIDPENPTSNSFTIELSGTYQSENFDFILSIANLRIIPGNYQVRISSKLMSNFKHTEKDIQYWIALEKNSTYGE